MKKIYRTFSGTVAMPFGQFASKYANYNLNRDHKPSHIRSFVRSIEQYGLIEPITVNTRTGHIINGGGRFSALMEMYRDGKIRAEDTVQVNLQDIPAEMEDTIVKGRDGINGCQWRWSTSDDVGSHVKANNPYYIQLLDFAESHTLTRDRNGNPSLRYAAALVTGKRCQKELKDGTLEYNQTQVQLADKAEGELLQLKKALALKGSGPWVESMIVSWHKYRSRCPLGLALKAVRRLRHDRKSFRDMPYQNQCDWDNIFRVVIDYIQSGKAV